MELYRLVIHPSRTVVARISRYGEIVRQEEKDDGQLYLDVKFEKWRRRIHCKLSLTRLLGRGGYTFTRILEPVEDDAQSFIFRLGRLLTTREFLWLVILKELEARELNYPGLRAAACKVWKGNPIGLRFILFNMAHSHLIARNKMDGGYSITDKGRRTLAGAITYMREMLGIVQGDSHVYKPSERPVKPGEPDPRNLHAAGKQPPAPPDFP